MGESLDSYCSLKSLWSGMGEIVTARTLPTLPHCAVIILFKVSQGINFRDKHFKD